MKRILCVDDSEDLREFYQLALQTAGYSVVLAEDGVEALELVRRLKPDLIITDVSMPRMDGLEFLERLRSDLAPPLPPVIVCSGFDMTAGDVVRRGASRFVPKPVDAHDLIAIVELTLRGESPTVEQVATQRRKVDDARARAAKAAAELLGGVDLENPALVQRRTRAVNWVARYYECGYAALALVDGDHLRVTAVSEGAPLKYGMLFDGRSLYAMGVLGTGSSLVLTDTAGVAFSDPRAAAIGFRFVVAVPLVYDGVPIGALCILDRLAHRFDAEDLMILEQFGRDLSRSAMTGAHDPLFMPSSFERLLAGDLAIRHRDGSGIDLAAVALHAQDTDRVCQSLAERAIGRVAFCRRSDDEIALYARGPAASDTLRALLLTIEGVVAVGWMSLVGDTLPSLNASELLQFAADALERAREEGPIVRVVVHRERTELRT